MDGSIVQKYIWQRNIIIIPRIQDHDEGLGLENLIDMDHLITPRRVKNGYKKTLRASRVLIGLCA